MLQQAKQYAATGQLNASCFQISTGGCVAQRHSSVCLKISKKLTDNRSQAVFTTHSMLLLDSGVWLLWLDNVKTQYVKLFISDVLYLNSHTSAVQAHPEIMLITDGRCVLS